MTLETVYVNPFYVVRNSILESMHVVMSDARVASVVAPLGNRTQPYLSIPISANPIPRG